MYPSVCSGSQQTLVLLVLGKPVAQISTNRYFRSRTNRSTLHLNELDDAKSIIDSFTAASPGTQQRVIVNGLPSLQTHTHVLTVMQVLQYGASMPFGNETSRI